MWLLTRGLWPGLLSLASLTPTQGCLRWGLGRDFENGKRCRYSNRWPSPHARPPQPLNKVLRCVLGKCEVKGHGRRKQSR